MTSCLCAGEEDEDEDDDDVEGGTKRAAEDDEDEEDEVKLPSPSPWKPPCTTLQAAALMLCLSHQDVETKKQKTDDDD